MKAKLDLDEEGLRIVFKDYEILMAQKLWEGGEYNSGEMHEYLNRKLGEGDFERKSVSQASVLHRLNWMAEDLGILTYRDRTGKGGYHRAFFAVMTESDFWQVLGTEVASRLCKASGMKPSMLF